MPSRLNLLLAEIDSFGQDDEETGSPSPQGLLESLVELEMEGEALLTTVGTAERAAKAYAEGQLRPLSPESGRQGTSGQWNVSLQLQTE